MSTFSRAWTKEKKPFANQSPITDVTRLQRGHGGHEGDQEKQSWAGFEQPMHGGGGWGGGLWWLMIASGGGGD